MTHPAIDFLRKVYPNSPWCLSAATPERDKLDTRTFSESTATLAEQWIEAWNGQRNLYWHVGEPRDPQARSKLKRTDVAAVHYLHVDIDPPNGQTADAEFRDRTLGLLLKAKQPPTIIINSGNGIGAFWALATPIVLDGSVSAADDAGLYNVTIADMYAGGDHCHNVDRLMRLPATWNIPGESKKKKGITERRLSELLVFDTSRVYDIAAFKKANTAGSKQQTLLDQYEIGTPITLKELTELSKWNVPSRVQMICAKGSDPSSPKKGDNSRSAWLYDCICQLIRFGVPDEVILGIVLDPEWLISESVLEKASPGPEAYARRQIEKAKRDAKRGEHSSNARAPAGDPHAHNGGPRPVDSGSPVTGRDVTEDFLRDDDNHIFKIVDNVILGIQKLGGNPWFDQLKSRVFVEGYPQPDLDDAIRYTKVQLDCQYRFQPTKEMVVDAIEHMGSMNQKNLVQDYLRSCVWDGTPRLNSMLATFFGADQNEVNTLIGPKWMISAVARAMRPGCKADYMLILQGEQGMKKSMALEVLFGAAWTNSTHIQIDTKDAVSALRGKWLRVFEECDSLSKKDAPIVKAFITNTLDTYRASYARGERDYPRQCVFAGTTNKSHYFIDETGGRRFWPVICTLIDIKGLEQFRDQLWAEAVARYEAGEHWWIEDAAVELQLQAEQESRHMVHDMPLKDRIEKMMHLQQGRVSSWALIDALRLCKVPITEGGERSLQTAFGPILKSLGWVKKTKPNRWEKGIGKDLSPEELCNNPANSEYGDDSMTGRPMFEGRPF